MPYRIDDLYSEPDGSSSTMFPGTQAVLFPTLFGKQIDILDVRWLPSPHQRSFINREGKQVFAVFEFKHKGESFLYSSHTGSTDVCRHLERAQARGMFPLRCTPIKNGTGYNLD